MPKTLLSSSLTTIFTLLITSLSAQQNILLTNSPILNVAAEAMETPKKDTAAAVAPSAEASISLPLVAEWTSWNVVENFTFGKDRGKLTMIADLNALHPYFRDKIRQLIADCKAQGIELAIVESFRTHAKQNEYMGMGKGYTNSAGGKSKHQYGLAVDVVPMVNNQPVWDNRALWVKVGVTGEKLGLRWGGRWKSPYDPAHFEWTGGLTSVHLASGQLPLVPSEEYPCADDDVKELREAWQAWERRQAGH